MQSVRLKKCSFFVRPVQNRRYRNFLNVLAVMGLWAVAVSCYAQAVEPAEPAPQTKEKFDVGVGGFYQITNASNGNSIREDTTESGGGLVTFRQPYKPWLGYEANVGYTKFFESYNKNIVKVQSNVTDFNVAYLLQAPTFYGVQPFVSLGGGLIVFSPITGTLINQVANPNQPFRLSTSYLPEFVYSVGLNYPLFSRLGIRGQLRGLEYKTPDFHQFALDTKTLRGTVEPTLSVYYRF